MQGDSRLSTLAQASENADVAARAVAALQHILVGGRPTNEQREVLNLEADLLEMVAASIGKAPTAERAKMMRQQGPWSLRNLRSIAALMEASHAGGLLDSALRDAVTQLRALATPTENQASEKTAIERTASVCREMLVAALNLLGSARRPAFRLGTTRQFV